MLKKIFHPLLVVSLLAMGLAAAACSDSNDEGPKSVELTGGTSTQQTVWADETQKPENITFKAAAPWTATVTDTTPVQTKAETGRVDWLTLSAYSGGAGNVSLTMTLTPNYMGADRKAEIRIVCGGTTLIITVEQKATTESGEKPAQSDLKNRIVRIEQNFFEQNFFDSQSVIEFTYDELGRLIEILDTGYYFGDPTTTKFTYGDKTVAYENICKRDGSVVFQENGSIELDENGRGVSGTCKGIEKGYGTWDYTYLFAYDANGQLVKTEEEESGYKTLYTTTWTNGNPTQVLWSRSDNPSYTYTDQATYETIENKTNLDLNQLLVLDTEGYDYSVGVNDFFAAMGYMGKRPKNMAKNVTSRHNKYTYEYQLDGQGRITKVVKIGEMSSTSNEYIIHYAE